MSCCETSVWSRHPDSRHDPQTGVNDRRRDVTMRATPFVVGIDVGGTFTDLVLLNEEQGRVHVGKVLTTPDDPAVGILGGLRELLDHHHLHASAVRTIV